MIKRFPHPPSPPLARTGPTIIPGLGVDVPELQHARALWQVNRLDEALALFEQAVRKYPQNLVALVAARRALGARIGLWLKLREMLGSPRLQLRYEDCVANLEREARRALEFLELPWNPEVLQYRKRMKTRPVSSPTYKAVSRPRYTSAIGRGVTTENISSRAWSSLSRASKRSVTAAQPARANKQEHHG